MSIYSAICGCGEVCLLPSCNSDDDGCMAVLFMLLSVNIF